MTRFLTPKAQPLPAPDEAETAALLAKLDQNARARLGRSLQIRHIDTGSCGACELELQALRSIAYDLERFGLTFTQSPRHADILLITGPITRNMQTALQATYEAMPHPKWLVALGDCAADGGVFHNSYAITRHTLPIDLTIRGCPPTPAQVLAALAALVAVQG